MHGSEGRARRQAETWTRVSLFQASKQAGSARKLLFTQSGAVTHTPGPRCSRTGNGAPGDELEEKRDRRWRRWSRTSCVSEPAQVSTTTALQPCSKRAKIGAVAHYGVKQLQENPRKTAESSSKTRLTEQDWSGSALHRPTGTEESADKLDLAAKITNPNCLSLFCILVGA